MQPHGGHNPARELAVAWLLMAGPTVGFALRYPLAGNGDRLTDLGLLADYGVVEFLGFVVGLVAFFAGYALGVRAVRRLPAGRSLPLVLGGGAALAAPMVLMYPVSAIDVFIYAVRSRLWTTYGENPSAALPIDYWDGDPFMRLASPEWADDTSPYGPLWNLVAAPVTLVAGDQPGLAVLGFKILAAAAAVACAWVIARTLAELRPNDAAVGALLFLWNPVVLWEGVANGHNDVVVMLLVLLALLAWARRYDAVVLPLLLAGGLVKYVPLLLLPLAAVALVRRVATLEDGIRLAARTLALALAVLVVAFFPFYDLEAVRDSAARQGDIFLTSPAAVALDLLARWAPGVDGERVVATVGQGIVLCALGWHLAAVWRRPDRLPRAVFEVLFALVLVGTFNFRPWYLIWPVAAAALLPLGFPALRVASWTAGALAGYGVFIWVWHWWPVDFPTIQRVAVALMFSGAVVTTATEILRARRAPIAPVPP